MADAQTRPAAPLLPASVAFDATGNLYFSDTARHQVYESTLGGLLVVVAGNGVQGFGGDGGAATNAMLNAPEGVAVGADGTLYIADTGNERIRAVVGGQIKTFAGTGLAAFGGDNGPAAVASFNAPSALALDVTGALLICDRANHRVRRVSAGIVTTIAGSGVQGYSGDGGSATRAQLDTPSGVAVSSDGRTFLADPHNNRVRVISSAGTISTFAGNGTRGFAGDGSAAVNSQLAGPSGLAVTVAGAVLIGDANNQRVRMVDAQGTITTIAGSGIQGDTSDGASALSASLNTPSGIAVASFGAPVFADALSHAVRELIPAGTLYSPAGLAPSRTSTVTLNAHANAVYGQAGVTVSVTGAAGTPQGQVSLLDGPAVLMQMVLSSGSATFPSTLLSAGSHTLRATYAGDGVNPAATSAMTNVTVASAVVVATADAVSIDYGQAVPALTGTLSGVQPQDVGRVQAVFTTTAGPLSTPATYPIDASLTGPASASYTVVLGQTSGSVLIAKSPTVTTMQPLTQSSYAGLPLVFSAAVSSTTSGTPSGTVSFTQGTTTLATATVANGIATGTYLSPTAGTYSITAVYNGDGNFIGSSSALVLATVGSLPDFTLATTSNATQTVLAGEIAVYTFAVAAQSAPFTGIVSMAVGGLPTGTTATFSPPQVIPGGGVATVVLSIQTPAPLVQSRPFQVWFYGVAVCATLLPLVLPRRVVWRRRVLLSCCISGFLFAGCGDRTLSSASFGSQTTTLNVTATSTNLAGAVVVHSTQITLVVQ